MLTARVLLGKQLTDANCFFKRGSRHVVYFVVEAIDFIGSDNRCARRVAEYDLGLGYLFGVLRLLFSNVRLFVFTLHVKLGERTPLASGDSFRTFCC